MAEKNKLISILEKLGLSNYEARAYLAAVNHPPMTGYKLSQLSGVPRSRIYETIEKLIARGLLVFQSGEKNLVTPLDFNTFLNRKENENLENIKYLRGKLPTINKQENENIWNITGRKQIMETVQDMVVNAQKYVYAEMFSQDLPDIKQAVLNRHAKGIPVWVIYCGKSNLKIKNFIPHLGDSCTTCHEVAVCVDGKQALIGCTFPEDSAAAALTQNKGFVYITEQYIKHEIFLHQLYEEKDKQSIKTYIKKYKDTMNQLP